MVKIMIQIGVIILFLGCCKLPELPMHTHVCDQNIYDLKAEMCLDLNDLATRLELYPVVFIGDHHDAPNYHLELAQLLNILQKRGYRIHFASEWFDPSQNKVLADYIAGDINATQLKEKTNWKRNVGFDFASYLPLYERLQKAHNPMYGINLSRSERQKISDLNLSAMNDEERSFLDNLDLNVSAHRMQMKPFFEHCHKPKAGENALQCSERMYRVQVAWDSKMALEAHRLERVLQTPKDKLIVFAGSYHLENYLGLNMRFSRLSSRLHVTLLPEPLPQEALPLGYSDFVMYYEASEQ
jgi:uncharacterized iron-regulated protein